MEKEENTRIISINKSKVLLWLLLSIVGGFCGYLFMQINGPIGFGFMAGTILVAPFFISKLFSNSPGFIISKKGITDNSGMTSHGFIPWSEIAVIGKQQVFITSCITLTLKDPKKYIDEASSGIKAYFWGSTYRQYKVSALISCTVLDCSYNDLLTALKNGLAISQSSY